MSAVLLSAVAIVAGVNAAIAFALAYRLRHTRRALELEKFYADEERKSHLQAESRMRDQLRAAMARDEVAGMAIDAAEAMTHDIARLVDALQDAAMLMHGKPQDWRRVAPKYRIDDRAFTPAALKTAAAAEWLRLIAEVQAAEPEPATSAASAPRAGHLRLVRNTPAPPSPVRIVNAAEPLDTIGPGIGA